MTQSTQKRELAGHELHKGQRTRIDRKRVVITRVQRDTVWYREETFKEGVQALIAGLRARWANR